MGDYRHQRSNFGYHNRDDRNRSRFSSRYDKRDNRQHQHNRIHEESQYSYDHQGNNRFRTPRDRGECSFNERFRDSDYQFQRRVYEQEPDRRPNVDPEAVKLLERLRGYTMFLVRRKREIIDQHKQRELEEEVDEIDYCLEVIRDVNADTKFGLEIMKSVHHRILELVRNNPISNAFSTNSRSDSEEEDTMAAPRSPSPVPEAVQRSGGKEESVRLIPMERSNVKTDWKPTNINKSNETTIHSSRSSYQNSSGIEYQQGERDFLASMSQRSRADLSLGGHNFHSGNKDFDYRKEGEIHLTKSSDYDYRIPAEIHKPEVAGNDYDARRETEIPTWNENNQQVNSSDLTGSFPTNLQVPPGFMPPALMNQMMMGLQLTQHQQQLLAMNMVQNQTQLFSPLGFHPQLTNGIPQLNNGQQHMLSNIGTSLGNVNSGLIRSVRPPLLPTPPMPLRPRFDGGMHQVPRNSFRSQTHLRNNSNHSNFIRNNPSCDKDKHNSNSIAMQFRQKAAHCFGNNRSFQQGNNSYITEVNQNETGNDQPKSEKTEQQTRNYNSNENIVLTDPRLKPRQLKPSNTKIEQTNPSNTNDSNRNREGSAADNQLDVERSNMTSRTKLRDVKDEAVRMLPLGSKARRNSSDDTNSREEESVKECAQGSNEPLKSKSTKTSNVSKEPADTRRTNMHVDKNETWHRASYSRPRRELRENNKSTSLRLSESINRGQSSWFKGPEENQPRGSMHGFRIPKIKKPEPPPPSPRIESPTETSWSISEDVITMQESPTSPEEPTSTTKEDSQDIPEKNNSVSDDITNSIVISSTKHVEDTDTLLRDFLEKSLSEEKRAKLNPENLIKIMESLKGELSAKLKELESKGDTEVEPSSPVPGDKDQSVSVEVVQELESNENDASSRKSRSLTRKKNTKRRSSLEKLHDALREMGFDSFMPTGPRRATGRIQVENILEPSVVEAVVNQLQTPLAEDSQMAEEEKIIDPAKFESDHVQIVKKKRGRKRKKGNPIVNKNAKKQKTKPLLKRKSGFDPSESETVEDEGVYPEAQGKRPKARYVTRKGNLEALKKVNSTEETVGVVTRSRVSGRKSAEPKQPSSSTRRSKSDNLSMKSDEPPTCSSENSEKLVEILNDDVKLNDTTDYEIPNIEMTEAEINAIQQDISEMWNVEVKQDSNAVFIGNSECDDLKNDIGSLVAFEMERPLNQLPQSKLGNEFHELYVNLIKPATETLEHEVTVPREDDEDIMRQTKETLDWAISNIEYAEESEDYLDIRFTNFWFGNQSFDEFFRTYMVFEEGQEEMIRTEESDSLGNVLHSSDQVATEDSIDQSNVALTENNVEEVYVTVTEIEDSDSTNTNSNLDMEVESCNSTREPRVINLEGHSLYKCASEFCNFTAENSVLFRDHITVCGVVSDIIQVTCFHCDKRIKSVASLMEHLKVHGSQKHICSLCSYRGWVNIEMIKHMKATHRVTSYKIIKTSCGNADVDFVMYPKDVHTKLMQPSALEDNTLMYAPKVEYSPSQLESIPRSAIYPSLVHCALCQYCTKVRSNLMRHLLLHERSRVDGITKVPDKEPVNPVPYLERKELMFDKMTNWAGSSHMNKEKSGVSSDEAAKLPQFILEQFRYVCSVPTCKQITGDDGLLRSHMKALHSDVDYYICPHCQQNEFGKNDPRNTVTVDKIGAHLKLHGPRLLKCGHCDHIHISTRIMERHVSEKHPERKPIHYMIRNMDIEGNNSNRRSSVDEFVKNASDRWRCTLCRALSTSWDEAKSHCETTHGIGSQFLCSSCRFASSTIEDLSKHLVIDSTCSETQKVASVMVMFSRNEYINSDFKDEASNSQAMWRRNNSKLKHIRGIYLEESKEAKLKEKEKPCRDGKERKEKDKDKEGLDLKECYGTEGLLNFKEEEASTSTPSKIVMELVKKVTSEGGSTSLPTSSQSAAGPNGSMNVVGQFVCPKCNKYKTKSEHDFIIHLHNEFQYKRYKCSLCKVGCVTVDSLKVHIVNDHGQEYKEAFHLLMEPPNKDIEDFVFVTITSQTREWKNPVAEVPKSPSTGNRRGPKPLEILRKCKHCNVFFSTHHNYKTHVIAKHIAPERFKCTYCTHGFWSEGVLKNHHIKAHPELEFKTLLDNEFEKSLTPEFWWNEYGIPCTKGTKGGLGRVEGISKLGSSSLTSCVVADSKSPKTYGSGKRNASLTCSECKKEWVTLSALRGHWTRVHRDKGSCAYTRIEVKRANPFWLCSYCSFSEQRIGAMRGHFNTTHKEKMVLCTKDMRGTQQKPSIYCDYCNYESDSMLRMRTHLRKSHSACILKYSSNASALKTELKYFEDKVLFECKYCGERSALRENCLNHMMTYHGEPMSTVEATTIFVQQEVVRSPETASKKLGPYECPRCDIKADNISELKDHMQQHLFAFGCVICGLEFKSPREATIHLRHDHGNYVMKHVKSKLESLDLSDLHEEIRHLLPSSPPVVTVQKETSGPSNTTVFEFIDEIAEVRGGSCMNPLNVSLVSKPRKHPTARKSTGGIPQQSQTAPRQRQGFLRSAAQLPAIEDQTSELQNLDLSSVPDFKYDSDEEFPFFLSDNLASPSSFDITDSFEWTDVFLRQGSSSEPSSGIDFVSPK